MAKQYQLSLFIFRRDLRLHDNTALLEALRDSEQVILSFIFDHRQLATSSDFFSARAFVFMLQSLVELVADIEQKKGQLYFFSGEPSEVVEQLLTELPIEAVYINSDYTPFSLKRDKSLQSVVEKNQRNFYQYDDALLHEPGAVLKSNGDPYVIYTPFMRRARQLSVPLPQKNNAQHYYSQQIKSANSCYLTELVEQYDESLIIPGGG